MDFAPRGGLFDGLSAAFAGGSGGLTRGVYDMAALTTYLQENTKNTIQEIHGGLTGLSIGDSISSGVPIALTDGVGKLALVVNAGVDLAGSITLSGTSIDRDTGVETPADSEVIVIDGASTDASTVDAEGNTIVDISGGYLTSKWWKGAVTFSTTDVNISDVDVYQLSFEQFNDSFRIVLNSFDLNALCTNTLGWLYAYLYTVVVDDGRLTIAPVATLDVSEADSDPNVFYRRRRGDLGIVLRGRSDGIFVELIMGANNGHWEDITMKVWAELT